MGESHLAIGASISIRVPASNQNFYNLDLIFKSIQISVSVTVRNNHTLTQTSVLHVYLPLDVRVRSSARVRALA